MEVPVERHKVFVVRLVVPTPHKNCSDDNKECCRHSGDDNEAKHTALLADLGNCMKDNKQQSSEKWTDIGVKARGNKSHQSLMCQRSLCAIKTANTLQITAPRWSLPAVVMLVVVVEVETSGVVVVALAEALDASGTSGKESVQPAPLAATTNSASSSWHENSGAKHETRIDTQAQAQAQTQAYK